MFTRAKGRVDTMVTWGDGTLVSMVTRCDGKLNTIVIGTCYRGAVRIVNCGGPYVRR